MGQFEMNVEPWMGIAVFGTLLVVLMVVFIVLGIAQGRREREAMVALAAELGLRFSATDEWDLPDRYDHFELTSHGGDASNVLFGMLGDRQAVAFDSEYTTGSGKDKSTHYYQAAVLDLPIRADRLTLRPEGFFDTLASWIGHDDLDFESDEFSRRYYVKCDQPKFAYDIFHARLIEYLLSLGDAPSMEMNDSQIMVYADPDGVDGLRRLLAVAQAVVRSIPDYVLKERGLAPSPGAHA